MPNEWKKIWNKEIRVNKIILESLIKADGFDGGAGNFTVDNWIEYTDILYKKLSIKTTDSIYDVGCGSGAFIYPLHLRAHKVGGIDYSTILMGLAKTMMPNNDFKFDEAVNIDTSKKYDFVLSHSVFQYFKHLDYAKNVIKKMVGKANKKIAIFDINDISKEAEYHQIRMNGMDEKKYTEKYQGLEYTFYDKDWFEDIAKELNLNLHIFDQTFKEYTNSKLRFNVIMEKI